MRNGKSFLAFITISLVAILAVTGAPLLAVAVPEGLPGASGTLWVTNSQSNTVVAFDAATGVLLTDAPIPVGVRPIGITAPHGTGKVYVSNETDGTVSVIEKVSLTVIETITLPTTGAKPHHIAQNQNGEFVYVAEVGTNQVAEIDTATDTVLEEFATGAPTARTHAVWATRNGKTLLATNTVINELAALDARTGELQWSLPVGANPSDVVTSPNSKLAFVSIRDEDVVRVIDLEAQAILGEIPVADQPTTLLFSPYGRLVVSHRGTPVVAIIDLREDPPTVDLINIASATGATATEHIAISANGQYSFVAFVGGSAPGVAVIDNEAGAAVNVYPYPGGGSPHGIFYEPGRTRP
jgi:YVTN family beta-propeller protein